MDRVTRIDLPGRLWKATRDKTGEMEQRMPCFVAGPENRLIAVAVESLLHFDPTFNPLILLGPTGCGKSHLAGGIAKLWHKNLSECENQATSSKDRRGPQSLDFQPVPWCDFFSFPADRCGSRSVAYLSLNDFGRLYRQAREQDKLTELQETMNRLRLLVLEELHLMRLGRVIQRELRTVVDRLLANGAMILATSQQPLSMITTMEWGLRDRLSSGLSVRMMPPDFAARLELLQLAADRRGTELDLSSARRMSRQVEGFAPQLFQALLRFERQHAQTGPKQDSFQSSISTISEHCDGSQSEPCHKTPSRRKHVTMHQIVTVVARYFSMPQAQLRGSSRRQSTVLARGVAVHLARMLTELSYAQIGHHLGNRDHTTTLHANRKLLRLVANDSFTQECVKDLKRIITAA